MSKRHSYTASFKFKVIKVAEDNSNRSAGRQFEVSEKLVRDGGKESRAGNATENLSSAASRS